MGKWAQREYEQQLVSKIYKLFQKSVDDASTDPAMDIRFKTFIQHLDPEDKVAQACFQSLVSQMMHATGRAQRSRRSQRYTTSVPAPNARPDRYRAASAGIAYPALSRPSTMSRPLAGHTLDFDRMLRYLDSDPSTRLADHIPDFVTYPWRQSPLADPPLSEEEIEDADNAQWDSTSETRRRSFSPSFSPSRARAMQTVTAVAETAARGSQSPPQSPSRVWLREYEQSRQSERNRTRLRHSPETLSPSRSAQRRNLQREGEIGRANDPILIGRRTENGLPRRRRRLQTGDVHIGARRPRDRDGRRDGIVFGDFDNYMSRYDDEMLDFDEGLGGLPDLVEMEMERAGYYDLDYGLDAARSDHLNSWDWDLPTDSPFTPFERVFPLSTSDNRDEEMLRLNNLGDVTVERLHAPVTAPGEDEDEHVIV